MLPSYFELAQDYCDKQLLSEVVVTIGEKGVKRPGSARHASVGACRPSLAGDEAAGACPLQEVPPAHLLPGPVTPGASLILKVIKLLHPLPNRLLHSII